MGVAKVRVAPQGVQSNANAVTITDCVDLIIFSGRRSDALDFRRPLLRDASEKVLDALTFFERDCFAKRCFVCCPFRGVATSERNPGGRPPRSHAPTTMAASRCRSPRRPLNVLAMCVTIQTVVFLCTTDSVTDSDGVSHTVFIYEGFALPHAILRILTERLFSFTATAERKIARDFMKKLCYIGLDHDTKLKSNAEKDKEETYELADGNTLMLAPNVPVASKCCSSHVSPLKKPADSATLLCSVMKRDVDTRKELHANVELSVARACSNGFLSA